METYSIACIVYSNLFMIASLNLGFEKKSFSQVLRFQPCTTAFINYLLRLLYITGNSEVWNKQGPFPFFGTPPPPPLPPPPPPPPPPFFNFLEFSDKEKKLK